MSDAAYVAIGAIVMAAINMAGSVLMLWIRARYNYREYSNGRQNGSATTPR